MSISSQLAELTFRIEVRLAEGVSTGTGFLYSVHNDEEKNTALPILVTNKHVIRGGLGGTLIISAKKSSGEIEHVHVNLGDFDKIWINHPDENIDLAAMAISPLLQKLEERKLTARIKWLSPADIPNVEELDSLGHVEDIIMVGYPNGHWDETNNYPLFRKGITATHPGKSFKGKSEFVIDIAAFPGSSGSPVFLFNEGSYSTPNGLTLGTRVKILGILYAGPQFTADGRIVVETVPTQQVPLARTSIPMNLGYVISSQVLTGFESVFSITSN